MPPQIPQRKRWRFPTITIIQLVIIIAIILFLVLPEFQPYRARIITMLGLREVSEELRPYREFPRTAEFILEQITELSYYAGTIEYTYKVPCPKAIEGIQDVIEVTPSPKPNSGYPDLNDPRWETMVWHDDNFVGKTTITVKYHIRATTVQWDINHAISGRIEDIDTRLVNQYCRDEWKIDFDDDDELDAEDDIHNVGDWNYRIWPTHTIIQQVATNITGSKSNVYLCIKSIYDYLADQDLFSYLPGRMGLPQDCLETLFTKSGDCDDYSILFCALCRAVGIPAWLELGLLYDPSRTTDFAWGGHAWVRVYIPLKNSTAKGTWANIDIVNREFMFRDCYRFTEWVDNGKDEALNDYYTKFVYIKQAAQPIGAEPKLVTSYDTEKFTKTGSVKLYDETEGYLDTQTELLPDFDIFITVIAICIATCVAIISLRWKKEWNS
jgi:hypothetical protein